MYILENITMTEFKKHLRQTKTIVFPFGTVEEHGSHLPLHTDAFIIWEVLKRVARKRKFFLAPLVYYGVCTTTRDHPGTISISPATLRRLSYDLVADSYKKNLRNFLLISGHGGSLHMSALKETAEVLVEKLHNIKIAVLSPYDVLWNELSGIKETPNDSHAGELETSIMLALAPHLVKGRSPEEYPSLPRYFTVEDKRQYWPDGVWGNPQKASSEKGEKALKLITDKIIQILDAIKESRP